MNPRVVWILSQYSSSPETGLAGRHYYLARELAKQGHVVYLISASNHHLLRTSKLHNKKINVFHEDGTNRVLIKTLKYTHSQDKVRIFNWFLFAWRALTLSKSIGNNPDVIIASSPSPFIFLGAKRLSKKYGARLIFDVRDIWPLALIELGGYSVKHPFIQLMQWVENKAYSESHFVSCAIPFAIDHMTNHGMDKNKFLWIPNGFDKEEMLSNDKIGDCTGLKIPNNKFVIGYVGSIGLVNAMSVLLKVAKSLNSDKSIAFVIVGKGGELKNLKSQAKFLNLTNVIFIDPVPKKQVQSVIQLFDACYIGWLKKSVYEFGISPQKLPEYLFSGKPVIHSYSGRGCVVKEANAGISVPAEDHVAIKDAILKLKQISDYDRKKLGENGKKYSMRHYDYKNIAKSLASVF